MSETFSIQLGSDCLGLGRAVEGAAGLVSKAIELRNANPSVRQKKLNKARKQKIKGEAESRKLLEKCGLDEERMVLLQSALEEEFDNDNVAAVFTKAIPGIRDDAPTGDVDLDWLGLFVDYSKNIFDEDMQNVWAAVLSYGSNEPGLVPRRVLMTLAGLSTKEAKLFKLVCRTCSWFEFPTITGLEEEYYEEKGLSTKALRHLKDAGLIEIDSGGFIKHPDENELHLYYSKKALIVQLKEHKSEYLKLEKYTLPIGSVQFTPAGLSLARSIAVEVFDDIAEHAKKYLESRTDCVESVELVEIPEDETDVLEANYRKQIKKLREW